MLQLFASLEAADVGSLKRHGMVGYLVVTVSDAMAIKPGLAPVRLANGLMGLMNRPVLLPETSEELVTKSEAEGANHFKNCKFNDEALEVHVTSMDDAVS